MVLIQVNPEDKGRVFEILSKNGRFLGLSDSRFSILEHTENVLKKLKELGIKYRILE